MPHTGHYNAIRQAKAMGDHLVVGVNSDEDVLKTKGPPVMNQRERVEIIRHCKFVDEVIEGTPYTPSIELLHQVDCGFYAHGDDPCFNADGVDITKHLKEAGMCKMFKRTEGVSTTDTTGKLLKLAEFRMQNTSKDNSPMKYQSPQK